MMEYFISIALLSHLALFAIGWWVGKAIYNKSPRLQNLGRTILEKKHEGLSKNPILKLFTQQVNKNNLTTAGSILFALIAIKSVGMILVGFVGISLLLMIVQGMIMYALIAQMQHTGLTDRSVFLVMSTQLLSHLSLGIVGNWAGYQYFLKNLPISDMGILEWPAFSVLVLVFLVTTVITAWKETLFYQRNKALIG